MNDFVNPKLDSRMSEEFNKLEKDTKFKVYTERLELYTKQKEILERDLVSKCKEYFELDEKLISGGYVLADHEHLRAEIEKIIKGLRANPVYRNVMECIMRLNDDLEMMSKD